MLRNELRAIAFGGLIAGTLDFLAAALVNWTNPLVILQVIASGVLGRASYADGAASLALGLLLQWFMSMLIAAIYVFAARWLPLLRTRWMAAGTIYGVIVYFVMNFVVVPLSASNVVMRLTPMHLAKNLPLMIIFGLIIAFFAAKTRGTSGRRA